MKILWISRPRSIVDRPEKTPCTSKSKETQHEKIRATIRKQLTYIKRDIKYLENYMEDGYAPTSKEIVLLMTIYKLYEQQQYMCQNKVHSVGQCIVSIAQPWLRTIVEGKQGPVEFGTKIHLSVDDTGHYPGHLLAEQIYWIRENRNFCKFHGIRLSGPKLGRSRLTE